MKNKQEPYISFYVAGCMEYEVHAEIYENLTLAQAVDTYTKIRKRNASNGPGIGFVLQDNSQPDYSGIHWPLFQGGQISREEIAMIPAFAEHPLVLQAVKEMEHYRVKLEMEFKRRKEMER